MFKILSRPQIEMDDMLTFSDVRHFVEEENFDQEILEQAEVQVKYAGYIEKERNNAEKLMRLEDIQIPEYFNYDQIKSLSFEAKEKFKRIRPVTISQASRISGVSPSDISVLLVHMGR
jgi:tRNA uridine 5-carboxymethylaminomethyl modification enzyme